MIYLILAIYLFIGFVVTLYHAIFPYIYDDTISIIVSDGFEFILLVIVWPIFPIAYFSIRMEDKKRI